MTTQERDPRWPVAGGLDGYDLLAFERKRWRYAGAKEQAVRDEFGISMTRYAQLVLGLIDDVRALQFDPVLTRRLQRMRDQRAAARSSRGRR